MQHTYSFEKLIAWQQARQIIKQIYLTTKSFPREEIFGITSQIRRAAISISCNLAEGSGRVGEIDQNRFYKIAYSSALEVYSLLITSTDLEYLSNEEYEARRTEMGKLTLQINRLVNRNQNSNLHEPDYPYPEDFI